MAYRGLPDGDGQKKTGRQGMRLTPDKIRVNTSHDGKPPLRQTEAASGTRFIEGTLRSGQKVEHPGDIVVLGDVNPGAVLEAGGNIVVMGSLRGIAHAGLNGSEDAFVAALLAAADSASEFIRQLRARRMIHPSKRGTPEMARLKDQRICVEPFLVRNKDNE
jgi:septum site-determining protein MinC